MGCMYLALGRKALVGEWQMVSVGEGRMIFVGEGRMKKLAAVVAGGIFGTASVPVVAVPVAAVPVAAEAAGVVGRVSTGPAVGFRRL